MAGPHITEETIVDGLDLFDDDDTPRTGVDDPISAMVGATAYVESFVLDACVRTFDDGTWTDAETFDRFYYERGLLIDIIDGVSPEEEERLAGEKNVPFKEHWCAENERTYVPLYMRAYEADPQGTAQRIFDALGLEPPAARAEEQPAKPTPMMLGGPPPEQVPDPPQPYDEGPAEADDRQPDQNPLAGVDLEALGYEETEEPLVLEDEHGVTRPPEPQAEQVAEGDGQAHEGAEAPADGSVVELQGDDAAPKSKPRARRARNTSSKVQRPGRKA